MTKPETTSNAEISEESIRTQVRNLDWSPFLFAAAKGDVPECSLLLNAGENVNQAFDNCGTTALHLAAFRGDLPLVELLCENGADTDSRSTASETLLGGMTSWAADVMRFD